jgi:benzoyl-CoA 2,3-dioxygenase component B
VAKVDYSCLIPNNVGLSSDKALLRGLRDWQTRFLSWWSEVGPQVFGDSEVYLRTAVSPATWGWAHFGYVRMHEYRWGIFLAPRVKDRVIPGGDFAGDKVWQELPSEHRQALQRLIVVQADAEPASVEQQRHLAGTCPSLYDCRNLFQVNVEEARHLWAMVYLLHTHFGEDGRNEADALLARRAGATDRPRLLDTFNEPCAEWLSFFCFTTFTDRDGKFQLGALAESGFDPLARTCRFMITEEAHHLFVGESGLGRIISRSADLSRRDPNGDVAAQGGIPLEMVQRYINHWYSFSLDLFGSEISNNASEYFAAGLKGRWSEARVPGDRLVLKSTVRIPQMEEGCLVDRVVPMRLAMNELLRREYVKDCGRVIDRLNRVLADAGLDFRFTLPHSRFNRHHGMYGKTRFNPQGEPIATGQWEAERELWLPTEADRGFLASLMSAPVVTPGEMAAWISPPSRGINGMPADFKYVRTGR